MAEVKGELRSDSGARHASYTLEYAGDIAFFRSPALSAMPGVRHGFTTRVGGVSPEPYHSLNLSKSRPDAPENVEANYRRLCAAAQVLPESLTVVNYAHDDGVALVLDEDAGRGHSKPPLPVCDAMITQSVKATLLTLHADCLGVFFYDPAQHAAGLAHAGWKGCAKHIGAKVLGQMAQRLGSRAEDVVCCIGAGICQKCFEVDAPVAEIFLGEYPEAVIRGVAEGKYHVDLALVMRLQLQRAGARHIEDMALCTSCLPEHFFSHRRDAGRTGAMAAYIRLDELN